MCVCVCVCVCVSLSLSLSPYLSPLSLSLLSLLCPLLSLSLSLSLSHTHTHTHTHARARTLEPVQGWHRTCVGGRQYTPGLGVTPYVSALISGMSLCWTRRYRLARNVDGRSGKPARDCVHVCTCALGVWVRVCAHGLRVYARRVHEERRMGSACIPPQQRERMHATAAA